MFHRCEKANPFWRMSPFSSESVAFDIRLWLSKITGRPFTLVPAQRFSIFRILHERFFMIYSVEVQKVLSRNKNMIASQWMATGERVLDLPVVLISSLVHRWDGSQWAKAGFWLHPNTKEVETTPRSSPHTPALCGQHLPALSTWNKHQNYWTES